MLACAGPTGNLWTVTLPSDVVDDLGRLRNVNDVEAILLARLASAPDGVLDLPAIGMMKALVAQRAPVNFKGVLPAGQTFAGIFKGLTERGLTKKRTGAQDKFAITEVGREAVNRRSGSDPEAAAAPPATAPAAATAPAPAAPPARPAAAPAAAPAPAAPPARSTVARATAAAPAPAAPTARSSQPTQAAPAQPPSFKAQPSFEAQPPSSKAQAFKAQTPSSKASRPSWEAAPLAPPNATLNTLVDGLTSSVGRLAVAGPSSAAATLRDYLLGDSQATDGGDLDERGRPLLDESAVRAHSAYGLFGQLVSPVAAASSSSSARAPVYLGVSDPFCMVAVGVQGAGKSHSLNVILENCLVHCPPYIKASPPLTTVVFHFDPNPLNFCEAVGLSARDPRVPAESVVGSVDETVVLVSPSYYKSRKAYYAGRPGTVVEPLLFRWDHLTADFIKSLMRVEESDTMPLYMSAILDMLRKMQKDDKRLSLAGFKQMIVDAKFSPQQTTGLGQRLQLLESLVAESAENAQFKTGGGPVRDVSAVLEASGASASGSGSKRRLVVVDLTDPMMSGPEANGIFQVVLSMFLAVHSSVGKIVVFDEAHKYIQPGGADPLSARVVSIARQMRHHGIRIAISTQSPKAIPPELLELCTVALLHRFQSREWFDYLKGKLPLDSAHFDRIMALPTGNALVFCLAWPKAAGALADSAIAVDGAGSGDADPDAATATRTAASLYVREVRIRPRVTTDMGMSKVHT